MAGVVFGAWGGSIQEVVRLLNRRLGVGGGVSAVRCSRNAMRTRMLPLKFGVGSGSAEGEVERETGEVSGDKSGEG